MLTTDSFVILNGPEDGTEFPIARAPFQIGHDPACAVNIRLDPEVRARHARVTLVSDGYRIRRTEAAPVLVDGKRAGTILSRVVRSGGIVQIGQTLLGVECVADGLASRSHGIIAESDFAWAVRRASRSGYRAARAFALIVLKILRRLMSGWLLLAGIGVLLYAYWPRVHYMLQLVIYWVQRYFLQHIIEHVHRLMDSQ